MPTSALLFYLSMSSLLVAASSESSLALQQPQQQHNPTTELFQHHFTGSRSGYSVARGAHGQCMIVAPEAVCADLELTDAERQFILQQRLSASAEDVERPMMRRLLQAALVAEER